VVDEAGDDGQVELAGVDGREAGVAVGVHCIGVRTASRSFEPDVVAHPDLVAVVEARRPGSDSSSAWISSISGRELSSRGRAGGGCRRSRASGVGRVPAVHGRPLLGRHHLERQLVVVAQEGAPLRAVGDPGGVGEDVDDRVARSSRSA
jgi:hypothetical protein